MRFFTAIVVFFALTLVQLNFAMAEYNESIVSRNSAQSADVWQKIAQGTVQIPKPPLVVDSPVVVRPPLIISRPVVVPTPPVRLPVRKKPAANRYLGKAYYVIAHMTNTPAAISWAATNQFANAIEVDLNFNAQGQLTKFWHGGPCICTFLIELTRTSVCSILKKQKSSSPCSAQTDVASLMKSMVSFGGHFALIVIDSKIDENMTNKAMTSAGRNVIDVLSAQLFGRGYRGMVIVSTGSLTSAPYIKSAISRANTSPYKDRIYFSFDEEGGNVKGVLSKLQSYGTRQRVFGTGRTAISPFHYTKEIKLAARERLSGYHGMTYIWTVDRAASMKFYFQIGAHGLLTNYPLSAVKILKDCKRCYMARPGDLIPPATVDYGQPPPLKLR